MTEHDVPLSAGLVSAPPALEAFTRADGSALERLYKELFERLEAVEPALRMFVPGSPDRQRVMARVAALAAEHPDPAARPPLFGVPFGVKDIIHVDDEPIRAGSLLPPDVFAGPEAACVAALKRAGAVPLGRTATTEFAYFEPGPTANPHLPSRTPGGSSSGSAAAVAAGVLPLALGTQTIGSVLRPASYCGVVGYKPTPGRIPNGGLVYFSRSVDQVGLFCARPEDLDTVMDGAFPVWRHAPDPARVRLGLPVGPYLDQAAPDTVDRLRRVLRDAGRDAGIEVAEVPCLEDIEAVAALHVDLTAGEAGREHRDAGWFPRFEPLYRPRSAAVVRQGLEVDDARILAGRRSMSETRQRLSALMEEHGLDAWASPAAVGEADPGLCATGSPAMNLPWTHAGLPVIGLPAGTGPSGLPLGLQLAGRPGGDEALAAVARALRAAGVA